MSIQSWVRLSRLKRGLDIDKRRAKYLGIVIARLIIAGDIDGARRLSAGRRGYNVPEARAIAGACRVASKRWHCSLSFSDFCW